MIARNNQALPGSMRWFERFLFAGLLLDLVNNFAARGDLAERLLARGVTPSTPLVIAMCVLAPAIGLIFWYFVVRKRSNVARWIMTAFVAVGLVGFVGVFVAGLQKGLAPAVIVATLAEGLKLVATAQLFHRDSAAWFRSK